MSAAATDAYAYLQGKFDEFTAAARTWADRHYSSLLMVDTDRGFSYDSDGVLDVDRRAVQYFTATLLPRKLPDPPATEYLMALADDRGQPLLAGASYRLTIPADMPVSQFWSVTVYDRATWAFVYSESGRTSRSSYDRDQLVYVADGSVCIDIGPAPLPDRAGNWIPTAAKAPVPTVRFYGLTAPLAGSAFRLPDVQRLDS